MSSLDLSVRPRGSGPLTFAPVVDGECDPESVLLDAAGAVALRPVEEGDYSARGTGVSQVEYDAALEESEWWLAAIEEGQFWDPDKHPRWPKGTPKAGQFLRVGERFELGGKEYDVESVFPGKIHARIATKGEAAGAATVTLDDKQLAHIGRPEAEPVSAATNTASGTSASPSGGRAGTATVIDPYVKPETHDASIPIPEAAQGHVTPEQWKRFGQQDQERYSQLMERYGKWSPGKSQTLINQAMSQAADKEALAIVTSGYSSQKGSSTGLTLSMHQVFSSVVKKLTGAKPSQAELEALRDKFERARAVQAEIASAMQWDLYNRTRAPDVSVFHKHSSAGLFDEIVSGKRPVFSGLSMSQHYRNGWWSNGCFATPMAIRHVVMSTVSGDVTSGYKSEQEVAVADPFTVDPARAMNWSDSSFPNGKSKWLEAQTHQAGSGEILSMLKRSFEDASFELPIPPSPPVVQMDSQGGKSYKDPPPEVWGIVTGWGTKTNAAGETVANVTWASESGSADPQPAQELNLQPGDFIMGNPSSPDKGTVYVIVPDLGDPTMKVAYYKLTEPDGVTPDHGGQAFHFEGGGKTKFKKIAAHFDLMGWEKQQASKTGEAQFNPQAWSEGVDKKLVSQMKPGDKFLVHGNAYEVVSPGSAQVPIKMLETGELGKINGDYKTPTLLLKPGYSEAGTPTFDPSAYFASGKPGKLASLGLQDGDVVAVGGLHHQVSGVTGGGSHATLTQLDGALPGKVVKDAPLASIDGAKLPPKPLGWTAPVKGDTLAYGGKKATVTKIMKDGTVQLNTHPGVVKLAPNDAALASVFSADKHELGAKAKLRDLPPGAKFHAGTGSKLRPYVVNGPGKSKGQVSVTNLDTGEVMDVSANKSFAALMPKVQGTPEPDLTHSTPHDPSVVNLDANEPHMDVVTEQLQQGDVISYNGVFYKVDSVEGKGLVTKLSDGSQIALGIGNSSAQKVTLYKLKGSSEWQGGDQVEWTSSSSGLMYGTVIGFDTGDNVKVQPPGGVGFHVVAGHLLSKKAEPQHAEPGTLAKFAAMPVGTHFKTVDSGVPFGPMLVKTGPQEWTNLATGDEHSSSFMPGSEIEYGVVEPPSGTPNTEGKSVAELGLGVGDKVQWSDGETLTITKVYGDPGTEGHVYDTVDSQGVKSTFGTGGKPDAYVKAAETNQVFGTGLSAGDRFNLDGETWTVTHKTTNGNVVAKNEATGDEDAFDSGQVFEKYAAPAPAPELDAPSGPPPEMPATVYDPSAYVSVGQSKLADVQVGEIFVGAKNGHHYLVKKTGAKTGLSAIDLMTGKKSGPWTYDKVAEHLMPKAAGQVPVEDLKPGDPVQIGKLKAGDQIKLSAGGKEQVYEIVSFGKGEAPAVQLAPIGPDLQPGSVGTAGTSPLAVVTFHKDAASAAAAKAQLQQAVQKGAVSAPAEVDVSALPSVESIADYAPFSPKSKTGGGYHFTKAWAAAPGTLLQDKNGNTFLVKQAGPTPVVSTGTTHAAVPGDHNLKIVSQPFNDHAGPLAGGSAQDADAALAQSKLEPLSPYTQVNDAGVDVGDAVSFVSSDLPGTWKITSHEGDLWTAQELSSGKNHVFGPAAYLSAFAKGSPPKVPGQAVKPSQLEVGDRFSVAGDTYEVMHAAPMEDGSIGKLLGLKNLTSGETLPTSKWMDVSVSSGSWKLAAPEPPAAPFDLLAYQEGPKVKAKDLKPGDVFKLGGMVAMVDSIKDGKVSTHGEDGATKGGLPASWEGDLTLMEPIGAAHPSWSALPDAPEGFTAADAPVGSYVGAGPELFTGSGLEPAVWQVMGKNEDGSTTMRLVVLPTGTTSGHVVGYSEDFAPSVEFGKFQPPPGGSAPAKVPAGEVPALAWVKFNGQVLQVTGVTEHGNNRTVEDLDGNKFEIAADAQVEKLPGTPGKPIDTPPFDVYDTNTLHAGPWERTDSHLMISSLPKGAVFRAPSTWNYPEGQMMHVIATDGVQVEVQPPEGGDAFEVPFGQLGKAVTVMKRVEEEHPVAGWQDNNTAQHFVNDFTPGTLVRGFEGTTWKVVSHDDEDKTTIVPVGNISQGDQFVGTGELKHGQPVQVSAYWKPSAYEAPTVGGWAFAHDLNVGDEFEDGGGDKFTVADKDSEGIMADSIADPDPYEFTPFLASEVVTPVFLQSSDSLGASAEPETAVETKHGLVQNTKGVTIGDLPTGAKYAGAGIVYAVDGPGAHGGTSTKIVENPGFPAATGTTAWAHNEFEPEWVPSGIGPKEPDVPVPSQLPPNTDGKPIGALQPGDHVQTEHGSVFRVVGKQPSGIVGVELVHGVEGDPVAGTNDFGPTWKPAGVQPGGLVGAPMGKVAGDSVLPSQLQAGDYYSNPSGHVFKVTSASPGVGSDAAVIGTELVHIPSGGEGKLGATATTSWLDKWAEGDWTLVDPSSLPDSGGALGPGASGEPLSVGSLKPFSPKSKTGGGYYFGKLGQLADGTQFTDKSGGLFEKVGVGAGGMTAYKDTATGKTFLADGVHKVKLIGKPGQEVASIDAKDAKAIEQLGGWENVPSHPHEELLFSASQHDFLGGMEGTPLADLKPGDSFDADGDHARVVAQKDGFLYFKTDGYKSGEMSYYSVPVAHADGPFYAVKV